MLAVRRLGLCIGSTQDKIEMSLVASSWPTTLLNSVDETARILIDLKGKRWLSRGQSKRYGTLMPSIERGALSDLPRSEKLRLERESIDIFRATVRNFAGPGEQAALVDDLVALMVLRHYGIPTRLLDWSLSPHVAAYFAASSDDSDDGEIWAFDEPSYEIEGRKQWSLWPETTTDGDPANFRASLTAFWAKEPPDWFVAGFYPAGFPRQDAQYGAYTLTARFARDHAEAIQTLLDDEGRYHLYVVPQALKPALREWLRTHHGFWRGSLFPDSAGAAQTAQRIFNR